MRTIAAVCCLLAVLCCAAPAGADTRTTARPSPTARVRGVTSFVTQLLADASRRSPTFASLVAALEKTDVIVHVEEVIHLAPRTEGRLMFTVATGGVRYLRVQVLRGMAPSHLMSVIGHELQHAVEVAEHRDVRDIASFVALYERIGERGHRGQYDTAAARTAGQRVRNELGE